MRILSIRTNHGPNVFHFNPTIVMTIDLEDFAEKASTDLPGFTERLIKILPGLELHTCSPGYPGGFIERLQRGTYMAHVIEHVAIELSIKSGIEVHFGKTRFAGRTGLYEVVTTFANEEAMKECLRQAVQVVILVSYSHEPALEIEKIKNIVVKTSLGPSGQALWNAAVKRDIPCRRIGEESLLQLGHGKNRKFVQSAVSSRTSLIAADIAQDKNLTKKILQDHFIPVPSGRVVTSVEELEAALIETSGPYVVKPLNGNHGRGVYLNLKECKDVLEAFYAAQKISPEVIIEEMCEGSDYRILVVNGKMVAAAERKPPEIVGTGSHSIAELIAELNSDPRRSASHMGLLSKIEIDEALLETLKKCGISELDFVPGAAQKIVLRETANMSGGATAVDVTDKVHPDIVRMCERAARAVDLDICGVDLIHQDISLPAEFMAKVIEVNAGPGLRMHLAPSEGQARDVAGNIIDMLYPDSTLSKIPIAAVTGTNGKTTVVRMLHKIFSERLSGPVGLTTTEGIWIGKQKIFEGDTTGPKSSHLILSDPTVEMAILEVARGGILRGGLAYSWADVAVITNIQLDHIGQDGIEAIEDILWIKSLVGERVKQGGTLVLNADDERVLGLREKPSIAKQNLNFFLFSKNPESNEFKKHLFSGGDACWCQDGYIWIQHKQVIKKEKVTDVPLTVSGLADFQIANLMAAASAALALGADHNQIFECLKNFNAQKENAGRFNIFKVDQTYVILDYGHNCDAFLAVGKMLDKLEDYRKTAVVGMPGDRRTDLMEEAAEILTKHYDHFVIREDVDLRGRRPGEVPEILQKSILRNRPQAELEVILDESEALRFALRSRRENEIIIVFYENLKKMLRVLFEFKARAVDHIPLLDEEVFSHFQISQMSQQDEIRH